MIPLCLRLCISDCCLHFLKVFSIPADILVALIAAALQFYAGGYQEIVFPVFILVQL
jgi:hypothetical protein